MSSTGLLHVGCPAVVSPYTCTLHLSTVSLTVAGLVGYAIAHSLYLLSYLSLLIIKLHLSITILNILIYILIYIIIIIIIVIIVIVNRVLRLD